MPSKPPVAGFAPKGPLEEAEVAEVLPNKPPEVLAEFLLFEVFPNRPPVPEVLLLEVFPNKPVEVDVLEPVLPKRPPEVEEFDVLLPNRPLLVVVLVVLPNTPGPLDAGLFAPKGENATPLFARAF